MKTFNMTISVMAISCAMTAAAHINSSDSTTTVVDSTDVFFRHLQLQEVVVMGPAGEVRLKDAPVHVGVIAGRELQSTAGSNIIDAVAITTPGVSQVTTGAGISKPVIRGLGYNRIVTVVDGIRQEGQQWGDEHGIEVDGEAVGSVEVLKGPGSLMYGSDAIAGVLKLKPWRTPAIGRQRVDINTEYQTNSRTVGTSARYAGNMGGIVWDWRWSGRWAQEYGNRRDGRVPGSQFRQQAASGMLGINRSWGHTHLKMSIYSLTPSIVEGERDGETGQLECAYGAPGTFRPQLPFQRVQHYKATIDQALYFGHDRLDILLAYQQNRRREYEESADEPGLQMRLHTVNYNVAYQLNRHDVWRASAGVNGMWQRNINSGDEMLIPDYRLFDFGVFATAARDWEAVSLSGGLRYDHRHMSFNALEPAGGKRHGLNFNGVTGSVGAVWHAARGLNLRLNAARGFRSPNISELASHGVHEGSQRYEVGDVSLKAEHSFQVDLGADYANSYVEAELSLFYNRIANYTYSRRIDEIHESYFDTYAYVQGTASLLGGEARVDVHPIHSLHIGMSLAMVDARLLHQPAESRYLPLTPATRWRSDVKFEFNHHGRVFCNTYVALGVDHTFRQNHYYAAGGTETATPAYTLLEASVGTDINVRGRHIATLRIIGSNLTDKVYQSHLSRLKYTAVNNVTGERGIAAPGRNITFKLSFPLEW